MKNGLTYSSNSTTGLLQNQLIDTRNYISTRNTHGPQIKLNYHRTSLSPVDPKHLPGSKNNMVETVAATAGKQLPLQKTESHNVSNLLIMTKLERLDITPHDAYKTIRKKRHRQHHPSTERTKLCSTNQKQFSESKYRTSREVRWR